MCQVLEEPERKVRDTGLSPEYKKKEVQGWLGREVFVDRGRTEAWGVYRELPPHLVSLETRPLPG